MVGWGILYQIKVFDGTTMILHLPINNGFADWAAMISHLPIITDIAATFVAPLEKYPDLPQVEKMSINNKKHDFITALM